MQWRQQSYFDGQALSNLSCSLNSSVSWSPFGHERIHIAVKAVSVPDFFLLTAGLHNCAELSRTGILKLVPIARGMRRLLLLCDYCRLLLLLVFVAVLRAVKSCLPWSFMGNAPCNSCWADLFHGYKGWLREDCPGSLGSYSRVWEWHTRFNWTVDKGFSTRWWMLDVKPVDILKLSQRGREMCYLIRLVRKKPFHAMQSVSNTMLTVLFGAYSWNLHMRWWLEIY